MKFNNKNLLAILLSATIAVASGQAYVLPQYQVDTVKNLVFGTDSNFFGNIDTLKLDLFKPVGDNNLLRPVMIAIHGGAWVAGDKSELWQYCHNMAQRGYVCASINYRLGHHHPSWISPSLVIPVCVYTPDSSEIIRAMYRAVQDAKAAIRFMKARHALDSADVCNYYLAGESAGGFTALLTSFLDLPNEKPADCYALPDATQPEPNVFAPCYTTTLPLTNVQLLRPDLGNVEGKINLNGYDDNVNGVVNFFGGVLPQTLTGNWMTGPDTPAYYLYHQTCDMIAPNETRVLLSDISFHCATNSWWSANCPYVAGSKSIADYFSTLPQGTVTYHYFGDDALCNYVLSQFPWAFNCLNVSQYGSFHYTRNPMQVYDSVANFLSPIVLQHIGNCATAIVEDKENQLVNVFPNPSTGYFNILNPFNSSEPIQCTLTNSLGQILQPMVYIHGNVIQISQPDLENGIYFLKLTNRTKIYRSKIIIQKEMK
ncbi:MAG: T9SS type A sorting domain-containing protein [Bacteroidetes bacterium]|nr:T9SS type A sorting domain-containing protein [Bacteroidota bacterium]